MIGGVILDQPAGGGIGAAKRGASSLRSRAARSGVVGPPASLAARRIRWRRAAGPCSEVTYCPIKRRASWGVSSVVLDDCKMAGAPDKSANRKLPLSPPVRILPRNRCAANHPKYNSCSTVAEPKPWQSQRVISHDTTGKIRPVVEYNRRDVS